MTYVLGITGGIGSGKTAATDYLMDRGVKIIDADVVARALVEVGTPALARISMHFGADILTPDGTLNRAKLRQIIFAHPEEKQWLDTLLHPLIRAELQTQLKLIPPLEPKTPLEQAPPPYVVLSAPLLFENGLDQLVDRSLLIDCDEETQRQRVRQRDGCTPETIQAIMQQQLPREVRRAKADDIIDNEQTLAELEDKIDQYHAGLCTTLAAR